jgi:hypothetical protein
MKLTNGWVNLQERFWLIHGNSPPGVIQTDAAKKNEANGIDFEERSSFLTITAL